MASPVERRCSGEMPAVASSSKGTTTEGSHACSNRPVPPAPFLTKTYQLVDDPSTDHVVSWGDDGATFVVRRPPEFARDLLPNYFKHSNFSSFVRQLNTYGFRKIVADRWEFANEFFRKGSKHLLSEIHRRKSSCAAHQPPPPPLPQPYLRLFSEAPSPPPPAPPVYRRVREDHHHHLAATLSEDNRQLRQRNALLLAELARMRRLYNDIIYFLQNHVEPVSPQPTGCNIIRLAPELGSDGASVLSRRRRPREDDDEAPVKLFGVRLNEGKRRAHVVKLEEGGDGDCDEV